MDDEQVSEHLDSVRVERGEDGGISMVFGETSYTLSEDDCEAFSRGLHQVVLNSPAALTVHFETDERSAYLEFD